VGGFNVFPAEVEAALLTHPAVVQAAVVGVRDERMGEVLRAFVVAEPGEELKPAALLRFARTQIAGYKLPYAIDVVTELPLLPSGKPDRGALAAR
jgi:acyl-CoA synthetase (AMP-forming)/AMP-acid ligase II